MIHDLDDIYDPDNKKGDSSAPVTPIPPRKSNPIQETAGFDYSGLSATNVGEYEKYMPEGVYDERNTREGLDVIRGQRQSVGEQLGRHALNLIPNIVASGLEMIGSMGSLISEWNDKRDYANAFTEIANQMKNPFGETYRHDNSTFALGDSAWWIDNAFNLGEMAISFAGVGGLVSRGMSAIAEAVVSARKLGTVGTGMARGLAHLSSAGLTAYMEEAMDGASVYDEVYKVQLDKLIAKGIAPKEAHRQATHMAAQSASSTVQIGTLGTTLLNLSALAPFFSKAEDAVKDVMSVQGKQGVKELGGEWLTRVKNMKADDYAKVLYDHHGMGYYLKEAASEGGEEVFQYFAEQTGREEGKKGKEHGIIEQLGQFENFIDRTMNKEGALAGILGAVGGMVQTALIHSVIPGKSTVLDKNGVHSDQVLDENGAPVFKGGKPVYKTQWVTPRTYDEWNTKNKFATVRDSLVEDIGNFQDLQASLFEAARKNDAPAMDAARQDLFDVNNVNAITSGMKDVWHNTYSTIGSLDNEKSIDPNDPNGPTEAMQRGYAKDRNDNEYKEKAREAVSDLNRYQEEYEKLNARYGTTIEANQGTQELVDVMFHRKVGMMSAEKVLNKHRKLLFEAEQEEDKLGMATDPEAYDAAWNNYIRTAMPAASVRDELAKDVEALRDPNTTDKNRARLIRKYGAAGLSAEDAPEATKKLIEKLNLEANKRDKIVEDANDMLFNTTGYDTWLAKNPGKTFAEYKDEFKNKRRLNTHSIQEKANVEYLQVAHDIQAQHFAEMWAEPNLETWAKKQNDYNKALHKAKLESDELKRIELDKIVRTKEAIAAQKRREANAIADSYKDQLVEVNRRLALAKEELKQAKEELAKSKVTDPVRYLPLKFRVRALTQEVESLTRKAARLDSLYKDSVDNSVVPPIDVDDIVDPLNGVDQQKTPEQLAAEAVEKADTDARIEVLKARLAERKAAAAKAKAELDAKSGIDVVPQVEEVTPETVDTPDTPTGTTLVVGTIVDEGSGSGLPTEDEIKAVKDNLSAGEVYAKALQEPGIDEDVLDKLDELEDLARRMFNRGTPMEIKLYMMDKLIAKGKIEQGQAIRLLQLLKEYLDEDLQVIPVDGVDDHLPDNNSDRGADPSPEVDITGPQEPDTPVIENSGADVASSARQSSTYRPAPVYHMGKKLEDIFNVANRTHQYVEGRDKDGNYTNVILTGELNKDFDWSAYTPNGIPSGTTLRFEVDTAWDGAINYDFNKRETSTGYRAQAFDRFSDYVGENGKIDRAKLGGVPIRIVNTATGKTLGYIHRVGYLNAQFEGAADLKNFAGDASDETMRLLELRELVVASYENGQAAEGKVTSVGMGTPILNHVVTDRTGNVEEEIVMGLARAADEKNSLLPGDTTIAIVEANQPYVNKQTPFTGVMSGPRVSSRMGNVVTLLPGGNGIHYAAPLVGIKLSERPEMINSVVRAMELYLLYDGTANNVLQEIALIEGKTGFDVSTEKGLRNFIKQYFTYLNSGFGEQHTSPAYNAGKSGRVEKFMMDIATVRPGELKSRISAGVMYGGLFAEAKMVNGKLDEDFVKALTRGFLERSRAVTYTEGPYTSGSIMGINYKTAKGQDREFTEILYGDGKWTSKTYPSYNEFVKSWSRTAVNGKQKIPGTNTHLYAANPLIAFEPDTKSDRPQVEQNTSATEIVQPDVVEDDDDMSDLEAMSAGMGGVATDIPSQRRVKEVGSAPSGTTPMTLASLEDLYSKTIYRNGKTPKEVFNELANNGHTFISAGFNPFSECR